MRALLSVLLCVTYFGGCGAGEAIRMERRDEHDRTELMRAAAAGDVDRIEELLGAGARIDGRVRDHGPLRVLTAYMGFAEEPAARDVGWSALAFAVAEGQLAAVDLLLRRGADVNVDAGGMTPIELVAARRYDGELIRRLLEAGAQLDRPPRFRPLPLLAAAGRGDTATVRALLDAGARPDGRLRGGRSPLMEAARGGHVEVVRMLLDGGADPELRDVGNGWTAYRWADHAGHGAAAALLSALPATEQERLDAELLAAVLADGPEAARRAIAAGASVLSRSEAGEPVLHEAARRASEEVALLLLDAGAPPVPGDRLVQLAVVRGHERLLARLIRAEVPIEGRLLAEAARTGQLGSVKLLLAAGLGVNAERGEALRQAARQDHLEVLAELLARGADPTLEDRQGRNALHHAVSAGRLDVTRRLLAERPDVDAVRDGKPLLLHAVLSGRPALVALLLEAGADPNILDTDGRSPLDHARRLPNPGIAELLVGFGGRASEPPPR
jgi:uncharacterized protein